MHRIAMGLASMVMLVCCGCMSQSTLLVNPDGKVARCPHGWGWGLPGAIGIGEAHGPFLFQGAEGLRAVNTILKTITPLVVGHDPFETERIWQDLFALTYTSVRPVATLSGRATAWSAGAFSGSSISTG